MRVSMQFFATEISKKEARIKAIRQYILSSTVNLEDSSENKSYVKEDLFDFSKEIEEDSEDSEHSSRKRAKHSISPLTGKNFQWFVKPSQRKFMHLKSVNFSGKGKDAAETVSSPLEAWSLLFSDDILNIILKYTNQEIERSLDNYHKIEVHHKALDMLELKAFIGLLYYASRTKKNFFCVRKKYFFRSLRKKFSVHSLRLFQETTSYNRLEFLFDSLLFDDKTTRDERIKSEKDCFAHIREIWNLFRTNCIRYYEPGYNVTIDEQILSYRGEDCTDIVAPRLSSKGGKYGLKFMTMNDSETFYLINAIPYISNVETESLGKSPSYYVNKISEPIHNTCRNITCGSWFTSVPLVDTMREEFSLTMVGSLRRGNPDVPPLFKSALAKETYQFAYQNNKTLMSYKSENDKMILLLSSLHSDGEINKVENKPEMVLHYNKTMGASDTFDQLCDEYTVSRLKRRTKRWSVRIFYDMLDQAAVNSFVLYTLNANNQVITRDRFILELSMALIKPYLIKLLSRPNLHISVQCRLKFFLDEQDLSEDPHNLRLDISNRISDRLCCFCPILKRNKTYYKCLKCNNSMCKIHKASICQSCAENQFFNHLP